MPALEAVRWSIYAWEDRHPGEDLRHISTENDLETALDRIRKRYRRDGEACLLMPVNHEAGDPESQPREVLEEVGFLVNPNA